MRVSTATVLGAGMALLLLPVFASGAEPRLLPFQARLAHRDGTPVEDGRYLAQFRIYDAPVGGNVKWDGEIHHLAVCAGIANVTLGARSPFAREDIFQQMLYLEITLDTHGDGAITVADPPMIPRQMIVPVVFAQDAAALQGRNWKNFFSITGGDVARARAWDADRFDGMDSLDVLTSPPYPAVARHALLADDLAGSPTLNGEVTLSTALLYFGAAVRQMLNLHGLTHGIGVQQSTEYFRSNGGYAWFHGGEHADNANDPGAGGETRMVLDANGRLGVGVDQPSAYLDIAAGGQTTSSLRLRSGDNAEEDADANQILMSRQGTAFYPQAVKSRHHSGQQVGNAIDFVNWSGMPGAPDGNVTGAGINNVLSVTARGVGIGQTQTPAADLDIGGSFAVNGEPPIFLKYCPNGGDKNRVDTGIPVADYNIGVIGFKALNGDIDENGTKSVIIAVYPDPSGVNWSVYGDFASHGTHESWQMHVIAVSTAISSREGF